LETHRKYILYNLKLKARYNILVHAYAGLRVFIKKATHEIMLQSYSVIAIYQKQNEPKSIQIVLQNEIMTFL